MGCRGSKSIVAGVLALSCAGAAVGQGPGSLAASHLQGNPGAWFTQADYPPEALRNREEGRVVVTLDVDETGRVTACAVTGPSASPSLNARTCELAMARGHFTPIPDAAGKTHPTHHALPVRWALPPESPPLAPIELPAVAEERTGSSDLWVDASGYVTRCEAVAKPYTNVLPPGDLCKLYTVGTRYSPPTLRHGGPVKRRVRITLSTFDTYLK